MNRIKTYSALICACLVSLIPTVLYGIFFHSIERFLGDIPPALVGLAVGLLGGCLGLFIVYIIRKKNVSLVTQLKIETNDERNIAIGNRAKAKAFGYMCFVYTWLTILFMAMNANLIFLGVLLFANISSIFVYTFCLKKYQKEM